MLVAMVVAVRQALDYQSTLRAIGVCVIGWVIQAIIFAFRRWLFKAYLGSSDSPIPVAIHVCVIGIGRNGV